MTAVERYREIRREMGERRAGELARIHCQQIVCRKGCTDCCTNLTVFPVEFYAMVEDLRAAGVGGLTFDETAACGFLSEGLCSIYAARPMICRTHGLPIAFVNMEGDEPEMSVSFCPKNFTMVDEDELSFGAQNTLNLDDLNMQLYEANLQFIEERPELGLGPADRIALSELGKHLY